MKSKRSQSQIKGTGQVRSLVYRQRGCKETNHVFTLNVHVAESS